MARTFHPIDTIKVKATVPPHHEGTEYWVSKGYDKHVKDGKELVVKVQLAINGEVKGMVVPSYPHGTDDLERVSKAIEELSNRTHEM